MAPDDNTLVHNNIITIAVDMKDEDGKSYNDYKSEYKVAADRSAIDLLITKATEALKNALYLINENNTDHNLSLNIKGFIEMTRQLTDYGSMPHQGTITDTRHQRLVNFKVLDYLIQHPEKINNYDLFRMARKF
jgi:NADP-dependent 3-hydroxy acid dehydrogenase YdfG